MDPQKRRWSGTPAADPSLQTADGPLTSRNPPPHVQATPSLPPPRDRSAASADGRGYGMTAASPQVEAHGSQRFEVVLVVGVACEILQGPAEPAQFVGVGHDGAPACTAAPS